MGGTLPQWLMDQYKVTTCAIVGISMLGFVYYCQVFEHTYMSTQYP